MEHPHLDDQNQLQDQLLASPSPSSSLSTDPSCYGVPSTQSWSQGIPLNDSNFNSTYNGEIFNTRNQNTDDNCCMSLLPSHNHNIPMIQQDLITWNRTSYNDHDHHQNPTKIKQELSSGHQQSFSKISETLNISPASFLKINHEQPDGLDNHDLSQKLLLKTISSGFPIDQLYFNHSPSPACTQKSFSQIYPSVNISNLNQSSRMIPSRPFDMNLQAIEAARMFSGSSNFLNQASLDHINMGFYKESLPFGHLSHHQLQQSAHQPSSNPSNQFSTFSGDEVKRSSILAENKGAGGNTSKKPRVDSRASSCPPLKVRKEKLGDRIAALQQLVAPFGKTDTASVLMEAIGYIKFLQNQVETLSVPYMRASRNKTAKRTPGGSSQQDEEEEEEAKRDLRSRGLCLVPVSCMSYVTGENWAPPPGFPGGTSLQ